MKRRCSGASGENWISVKCMHLLEQHAYQAKLEELKLPIAGAVNSKPADEHHTAEVNVFFLDARNAESNISFSKTSNSRTQLGLLVLSGGSLIPRHHISSQVLNCYIFHAIMDLLTQQSVLASSEYREALAESLLYFEAQRSGRLPYHQRVQWRGHSGLTDGLEQGVDLVGGYYDAGDNVKFGLPMAFTVTMLSWGVAEYGEDMAAAGELRHALEAIKWGTDYFVKAHTQPHELWAQVGDGDTDHGCWQRPEDMTTSRKAYKVDPERPGSEVAAETAAAMAAASVVFKQTDPHYSHVLLHHAQQLFEFGDKYRGRYDESVEVAAEYYPSESGYGDELLWAALWLHRATGKAEYLDYAVDNAHALNGAAWAVAEFSWDIKYAGVQILASKILMEKGRQLEEEQLKTLEEYRDKAEHYLCACLNMNLDDADNVRRSPAGLLFVRPWNNMQYVAGAAFLLTVFADYLSSAGGLGLRCARGSVAPRELVALARAQADYILGANPAGMSYLVGHGRAFPAMVHHRAASSASQREAKAFVGCAQGYDEWYGRRGANLHVLVGAVVGGPDERDQFADERGNYMQTEACTYNTAPLVGVFARLSRLDGDQRTVQF